MTSFDIAWHNSESGETQLWFMVQNRIGRRATVVDETGTPIFIGPPFSIAAVGDMNGNGNGDLVWHNSETGEVQFWFMDYNRIVSRATVVDESGTFIPIGPPFRIVGSGDMNGDGIGDLVWHHSESGETQIWFMNGNRIMSRATVVDESGEFIPIRPPFSIVGVGDMNGDGKGDLVWHQGESGETQIWFMNGHRIVNRATVIDEGGNPILIGPPFRIVGAGDMNGDGKGDLVWHQGESGETQIWFMNAHRIVSRATVVDESSTVISIGPPFRIAGLGEFNCAPRLTQPGVIEHDRGLHVLDTQPPLTAGDIERIGGWLPTLPPPDRATDGELHLENLPVWWLSLNNDQTHALAGALGSAGGTLAAIGAGSPLSLIGAAILAAFPYIEAVNKLGGNHGVDITGVFGTAGVIVTPRVGKVFNELIKGARLAVQGRTILDFVVFAGGKIPPIANLLQLPAIVQAVSLLQGAAPVAFVVSAGAGWLIRTVSETERAPGAVVADRDSPREWERFILAQIGSDEKGQRVSLLSSRGFLSAQMNGGHGVYADRSAVDAWELWTLIRNNDGTVSLQANDGSHYLCAEEGGGRECQVSRTQIGAWEKFWLEFLPDGHIALKTLEKGKYVSVQP